MFLYPLPHIDSFVGPFQSYLQDIMIDGFGNKIGGFKLETLYGKIHVPVTGNHNDFRIWI